MKNVRTKTAYCEKVVGKAKKKKQTQGRYGLAVLITIISLHPHPTPQQDAVEELSSSDCFVRCG